MHQMYFTEQPMSAYPARELGLESPFETNQPVSIDYLPGRMQPARAAAE